MRVSSIFTPAMLLAAVSTTLPAQAGGVFTPFPGRGMTLRTSLDQPRSAIGVTTSGSATVRDTLGVFVTSVMSGSPAEKAGIEEGNRIASINTVSLKLAAPDVGDEAMSMVMTRRLLRELDRVKPGDDVELKVYGDGKTRSVRVKTVSSDSLYHRAVTNLFNWSADRRGVIGLTAMQTGSARDTIGVFVVSVDSGSPAAKAGIEEGNRIVAVNGVDLKGTRTDVNDRTIVRMSTSSRFEREMAKVKPGDDVELRVYSGGQFRTVKTKAVAASELPNRRGTVRIFGPPDFPEGELHATMAPEFGAQIRRAIESGLDGAGRGLEVAARALDGIGRGLRSRVEW